MEHCAGDGSSFEMRLSRPRAAKYRDLGVTDHEGRFALFSQVCVDCSLHGLVCCCYGAFSETPTRDALVD